MTHGESFQVIVHLPFTPRACFAIVGFGLLFTALFCLTFPGWDPLLPYHRFGQAALTPVSGVRLSQSRAVSGPKPNAENNFSGQKAPEFAEFAESHPSEALESLENRLPKPCCYSGIRCQKASKIYRNFGFDVAERFPAASPERIPTHLQ